MTAVAEQQRVMRTRAGLLVGFGALLRLYLRVSRLRLILWIVGLTALNLLIARAFPGLYPDPAARQLRATLIGSSPATVSLSGPGFGLDNYTFGAMLSNEMLGFVAVLVALMAVFLVVRHCRGDEEAGRTELVRAGIVGRHAPMAAAFAVTALASVAVGVLTAGGLAASGVPSLSAGGSVAYGAALTSVGLVFGAIGLVTSQVSGHTRSASGLAGLMIGVAYLLRALGDIGENVLRWLSPIGWAQQTGPYVLDRVWPLLIAVVCTVVLLLVAIWLNDRRDHGSGTLQPRPGRERAARSLGTPFGLAFRLQRSTVVAWAVALSVFAAIYGTLLNQVQKFASENQVISDMLAARGSSLIAAFLAMIVGLFSMLATIFAIQAVLRIVSEESSGRAEPVLATGVSRVGWAGPHILIAALGSAAIALLAAGALGTSGAAALGRVGVLRDAVAAAGAALPAVLISIGIAVLLVGWAPRFAVLSWLVVGWAIFVGTVGGLLQLPQWAMNLSPFTQMPAVPAEPMSWVPILLGTLLGVALIAAGLVGLRRRDLATG